MNNKEFIAELASRTGFSVKDTQTLVNNIVNAMGDAFQEDNAVLVPNFGVFETKGFVREGHEDHQCSVVHHRARGTHYRQHPSHVNFFSFFYFFL